MPHCTTLLGALVACLVTAQAFATASPTHATAQASRAQIGNTVQARSYQTAPPERTNLSSAAAPSRPQNPRPPLPYHTQEVTLYGAGNVRLQGTLTLPQGKGPFPATLLLGGSGPQDRDNTLAGHRPFLVLADHLARAGIASLRLDDRGTGSSAGWLYHTTYADLSTDTQEALTFLRRQPRVRADAVGLIGHSEGASIALLSQSGAPRAKRANFAVLLAGPAVQGRKLLAGQVAQDYPSVQQQRQVLERLVNRWQASPYLRDFLAYDPAPTMRRLAADGLPILALYGGRDMQVYRAAGYLPAQRALRGRAATVTEWPKLNHFFQPAATGREAEYAHIATTLEPRVMQQVSEWVWQQAAKSSGN